MWSFPSSILQMYSQDFHFQFLFSPQTHVFHSVSFTEHSTNTFLCLKVLLNTLLQFYGTKSCTSVITFYMHFLFDFCVSPPTRMPECKLHLDRHLFSALLLLNSYHSKQGLRQVDND
jgi:hypothetical protein